MKHPHTSIISVANRARLLVLIGLWACLLVQPGAALTFEDVVGKAGALAAASFEEPEKIPDWLLAISYDQWRDIRFKPEGSLWRGKSKFEIQMFHPGLFYDRTVQMTVVDQQGEHDLQFAPGLFDYGKNEFASRVPEHLGFAGFRVHYPINRAAYKDEVIVFLGASYFRAVGKDLGFGISARGVAVDTALPSGEEFPFFKHFWLLRPTAQAKSITILALLDSPRITGALQFTVTPGTQTTTEVKATFFTRSTIEKVGLAPLTSMFWTGESSVVDRLDYRPEIHDSDGLSIESGTEWIWRPLENPERLRISSFKVSKAGGFGLLQRDRDFDHYQDLETRPEQRPSVWIEPTSDWGAGHVELIEIPTRADTNDNIVAFWVTDQPIEHGKALSISYRMSWFGDDPSRPPGGRVVATRRDTSHREGARRFVIDFEGRELSRLPDSTSMHGSVNIGSGDGEQGEIIEQLVIKNPITGGWRLIFEMQPKQRDPIEIRAFLKLDDKVLTETWSYVLEP